MSSPNHFTSDIEDAFSSMNILNYTSVSSDYFPASSGSSSFNSSENSTDNMIPPVFSSFYNNPCLKDVQAFYAKELPISSPDPITPPAILTLSLVLPPSLLFDPRYFFVPEELLPPKKQIHSPSSSSTTLSNSSRNQTCDLVSPSSLVYTPTPPQVFEIGKCSDKMYLKHHEKQVEDILNYLDELSFHRIEKMEEGRINGNELKTELKRIRTQIIKLQKKRLGQKDKIAFAHYRISDLEQIIEKIQAPVEAQTSCIASTSNPNNLPDTPAVKTETTKVYQLSLLSALMVRKEHRPCRMTSRHILRRFQELAVLCPNMVPNSEKLMEAFIWGLPQSIEGNVTASKPQTREEATNIAHI
ncbi:hypothetical protein Tco_1111548 [Tanacetum coccineum]|uniref:Uncharacterized protein n=1 Tax=Tanacetum coccineum TaxID=301880 RepID=A0ABQ5INE0_9ASTR